MSTIEAEQTVTLGFANEVSMTPLIAQCLENKFALLADLASDEIIPIDPSEPMIET